MRTLHQSWEWLLRMYINAVDLAMQGDHPLTGRDFRDKRYNAIHVGAKQVKGAFNVNSISQD